MKICVIGNSHSAALRNASVSKSIEGVVLDYFVIPGADQPCVALEDGRIRSVARTRWDGSQLEASTPITTVEGAAANGLDLTPYEGLLVSACGLLAARNTSITYKPAHPLGYLSCVDWLEEPSQRPPKGNQLVTSAVFRLAVESHIRAHPAVKLAFSLSEDYPGTVYLQPWPAPSRSLKRNPRWFPNAWYGARGPDAWFAFFDAQRLALEAVVRELGPRSVLLDHPLPEALDDGFVEEAWFGQDPWHANAEYGKLVLDQLAKKIASAPP